MFGIVDVGGGLRGIYGAGVLDYCLKNHIFFDYLVGVSAGSANLISYAAGQKGRNFRFYTDFAMRREYMSLSNYLHTRNYIDLDYIYGTLSNKSGESPLDFEAALHSGMELDIVATDALTGDPHYFTLQDMAQDDYQAIKASCCLPLINRPVSFQEKYWYDGGLSDPIPVRHALEAGCDKVVVILTKPQSFHRDPKDDAFSAHRMEKTNPVIAELIRTRADKYNAQLEELKSLEAEGKVLVLAPESTLGMKTLTRDKEVLKRLYRMGQDDAAEIHQFLDIDLDDEFYGVNAGAMLEAALASNL